MTNTTPSSNDPSRNNVVPSEVGWQFVPQYYTYVNKSPQRLHCFYNKTSTFIHGTEGEDGTPCFGQQVRNRYPMVFMSCLNFSKEIHNKITSIGFEDCKVFIHSVDAQSSANGGIIIQVIGEMSNRGEPWRRFVQTFFLAEQPNGYFVLNDIFRFLKEESGESDEGEPEQATVEAEKVPPSPLPEAAPPLSPVHTQPVLPDVDIPAPEPVQTASPPPSAAPVEETLPVPEPIVAEPHTNGHAQIEHEAPEDEAPAPAEKSPTPEPEPALTVESPPPAASPAPPPAPSPVLSQPPVPAPPSQPAQAPPPPAPKTWANLAASNLKKWGSAVAQESRGTSEAPAASSSSPGSGTQTPVSHHGSSTRPQQQPRESHPAYVAANNVSNALCFVKVRECPVSSVLQLLDVLQSVQENVTEAALRTTLTSRFGPIKDLDLVRNKACAFLEFNSTDAARRAIVASLPSSQGGEGGIRIDVGDGQQVRITVETRKERGERPPSRPRGGPPMNGDMRGGGFRARGGPGRGRGIGAK
jgi:Nuclear transport factor 2 (NTF2) domain/RNA recognition motif. (a.k.a. RRM, RBD, or RNP domain)